MILPYHLQDREELVEVSRKKKNQLLVGDHRLLLLNFQADYFQRFQHTMKDQQRVYTWIPQSRYADRKYRHGELGTIL